MAVEFARDGARPPKVAGRRIGLWTHCALFSHFDSRGGSMLVQRPSFTAMLAAYVDTFCPDGPEIDPEQVMRAELEISAMRDDFEGLFDVDFFDVEPQPDMELDAKYEGQYYIGRVHARMPNEVGILGEWRPLNWIIASVLGDEEVPDWPMDEINAVGRNLYSSHEFKVETWSLGEDAFGLRWI